MIMVDESDLEMLDSKVGRSDRAPSKVRSYRLIFFYFSLYFHVFQSIRIIVSVEWRDPIQDTH
jgi:hypothetical protein